MRGVREIGDGDGNARVQRGVSTGQIVPMKHERKGAGVESRESPVGGRRGFRYAIAHVLIAGGVHSQGSIAPQLLVAPSSYSYSQAWSGTDSGIAHPQI